MNKKFTRIKREIFKHKYYIVQRDYRGRILGRVKWLGRVTPIKSYRAREKVTGSVIKGVERTPLTNVVEVIDLRKKPRIPRKQVFQGVAKSTLDKKVISARSNLTTSKSEAIEQAKNNLYIRAYAEKRNLESGVIVGDERAEAINEGQLLLKDDVEIGVVYYQKY